MESNELILASANAAVGLIGSARFTKLTETGLSLVASELRQHLHPDDEPGMLIAVSPTQVGKDPIGYMLVLKGRTILAWSTGLRPKSSSVVLPITDNEQIVQVATIPKTWRQPEKLVVDLVGPPTYRVEVFNDGNMAGALNMARGIAAGWATLS